MTVLGVTFTGSYLAMRGGGKKEKAQSVPINASTKEEEDFIQYAILAIGQRFILEEFVGRGCVLFANCYGLTGNSYEMQTPRKRRQSPSNSTRILGWDRPLLPI